MVHSLGMKPKQTAPLRIRSSGFVVLVAVFALATWTADQGTAARADLGQAETAQAADDPVLVDEGRQSDEGASQGLSTGDVSRRQELDVHVQRLMNDHVSDVLRDRSEYIDRWLFGVAIFLTLLSIVSVVGG